MLHTLIPLIREWLRQGIVHFFVASQSQLILLIVDTPHDPESQPWLKPELRLVRETFVLFVNVVGQLVGGHPFLPKQSTRQAS